MASVSHKGQHHDIEVKSILKNPTDFYENHHEWKYNIIYGTKEVLYLRVKHP